MANNEMLALDLDLFDVQKNAYIPQETPKKRIQKPKLLETKPVSRMQTAQEAHESTKMAIRACAFALTMFLTIGAIIVCHVQLTNLQIDLTKKQNELSVVESENISLKMKYNSMMSMDKIEEYAQSELGMVKRESYQVEYFDISDESGAQLTQ
jgi:cell division protein FtsB